MNRSSVTRCDLHVHSSASLTSGAWFSEVCGAPESYVAPEEQYELARSRGMHLVTLTDHDSIEGGLNLLGRPGFFLSEEITAVFPENGCLMHVLAWRITPAQHVRIQQLRTNIYDLSTYLRREGIAHGLAHPLLSVNWRLDAETLEKCLVLFPVVEAVNGLTDRRLTGDLSHLLASSSPEILAKWASKHDLELYGKTPGRLVYTAGSDDHVGLHTGRSFVEVDGRHGEATFFDSMLAGHGRLVGQRAHLDTMAATIGATSYRFLRNANEAQGGHSPFTDLIDMVTGDARPAVGPGAEMINMLLHNIMKADRPTATTRQTAPEIGLEAADVVAQDRLAALSDALLRDAVGKLLSAATGFDVYGLIGALPQALAALMAIAPRLFAADDFGRQYAQTRRVWSQWSAFPPPASRDYVAVFSDTLDDVNGVAAWCERFRQNAEGAGRSVWLVRCGAAADNDGGTAATGRSDQVSAIIDMPLPFYEQLRLRVPSLGETVAAMWRRGVTHVEIATPGPIGLIGLIAAKILHLPVTATHHTDVSGLVRKLSENDGMVAVVDRYLRWFYDRADRVFVLSKQSEKRLVEIGVGPSKIEMMPVAIDPDQFSPAHRNAAVFESYGLPRDHGPVVLSVGRLSKEKNLPRIVAAVDALQCGERPPALVIVGEGPEHDSIAALAESRPYVHLLGPIVGPALQQIYASAAAFVFASEVDTLGWVNLEALASGLPVLVPRNCAIADGAVRQRMVLYEPSISDLAEKLHTLLADPRWADELRVTGRLGALADWGAAGFDQCWAQIIGATAANGALACV